MCLHQQLFAHFLSAVIIIAVTQLKPGVEAPDFSAIALDGRKISLRSLRGKKVWLAFYRYARCPLCNLYLFQIGSKVKKLRAQGLEIISIFESKPELFPQSLIKETEPMVLISDVKKEFYDLYEVRTKFGAALHPGAILMWVEAMNKGFKQMMPDGKMAQVPGHFLINELGIIEFIKYGVHIGDHVAIDKVEAFVGNSPTAVMR
jgi:peroxiredoxin Q/BCP